MGAIYKVQLNSHVPPRFNDVDTMIIAANSVAEARVVAAAAVAADVDKSWSAATTPAAMISNAFSKAQPGWVFTLTINGTPYTYTTVEGNTPDDVANALLGLVIGTYDLSEYRAPSAIGNDVGLLLIDNTGHTINGAWVVTLSITSPAGVLSATGGTYSTPSIANSIVNLGANAINIAWNRNGWFFPRVLFKGKESV